jgi:hypothetical protein
MRDAPCGGAIGEGYMYHILAAQRHRQDGAAFGKNQALLLSASDPPGLVERAIAVLARIGGMDQQMDLAGARRLLDPLAPRQQGSAAGFEPQPVKRLLAKALFDPLAKVGRNIDFAGLERSRQGAFELALGIGLVERRATDADPRAASGSAGADVRSNLAVGTEGEPDQILTRRGSPGKDAAALRDVRL